MKMSPIDELIEIVLSRNLNIPEQQKDLLLKRNNINEDQWNCFIELMEDLDLNYQGALLLIEEIKSGRVLFPTKHIEPKKY